MTHQLYRCHSASKGANSSTSAAARSSMPAARGKTLLNRQKEYAAGAAAKAPAPAQATFSPVEIPWAALS